MAINDFCGRIPVERRMSDDHLIEDDSERIDVCPLVERAFAALFRRHVDGRSDERKCVIRRFAGEEL